MAWNERQRRKRSARGRCPVVSKGRTQRGKCETQDEMEFLSVELDKQPQFCSRDRSQPKRRRLRLGRDARFSTPCTNLFFPPSPLFSEPVVPSERNFSSHSPPLYLSLYRFFYCDRFDRFYFYLSYFLFLYLCIIDPVSLLKSSVVTARNVL